ncbi:hypothetical protein BH11PLA2_BH11PLA2_07680 [soil metagenome]
MPTLTIESTTESERLQLERMVAYVREMNALGMTAAPGTVLDACESFALDRGRRLIRDQLAAAVQGRGDAEKNAATRSVRNRSNVSNSAK